MTLLFLSSPALAATLVGTGGMSLEQAIESAQSGDTLRVVDGDWAPVTIDLDLTIDVMNPQVRFQGLEIADGAQVSLNGGTLSRVEVSDASFSADSVVFVEGLTPGFAVQVVSGTVSLNNVDLRNWSHTAIDAQDAIVWVDNSLFANIVGSDGGAFHAIDSDLTIRTSSFSEVSAQSFGGAIYAEGGSLVIQDSLFQDGSAGRGGHIALSGTDARFTRVSAIDGHATDRGGSFYSLSSTLTLREVEVQSSSAPKGGGMAIQGGSVFARDIAFRATQADLGAGLWADGGASVELTRSQFTGGMAREGGAIAMERGHLVARNGFWTDGEWADIGGALFIDGGVVELSYILVADNQAEVGAGIAVQAGSLSLDGCIVYANSSEGIANAGGQVSIANSLSSFNAGGDMVGQVTGWDRGASLDPRFVSPAGDDWALSTWSPAIDSGPTGQADRDGTHADMGPYGGPDSWRLADTDGDGWVYGRDCDDLDEEVYPYAPDIFYDGVDSDCLGNDDFDADGDGWSALEDCNDTDASVYPGAFEANGDSIDADCDGVYDADADGDGWTANYDCDDLDPSVHPMAPDAWYDGIDSDCVGNDDFDADADGWSHTFDCDDSDPLVSPGSVEIADDGVDQDCDGADDRSPSSFDTPLQSTELFQPDPPSAEVRTGCSSTGAPPTFLAAVLTLVGLLLHRR